MTRIKKEGPYESCGTSSDKPIYGVEGPGEGLGYYAWYGHPHNTFSCLTQADQTARMMNIAYNAGLKERSREIMELLK
jgi:hypothetical protein